MPPPAGPAFGLAGLACSVGGATKLKPAGRAEEPAGFLTETFTAPAASLGVTALICVGDRTLKLVAAYPPKLTELICVKFAPVMFTVVPPEVDPSCGEMPLIVG